MYEAINRIAFLITTRFAQECAHSFATELPFKQSSRLEMKHRPAFSRLAVNSKESEYRLFISLENSWQNSTFISASCGRAVANGVPQRLLNRVPEKLRIA